MAIIEFGNTLYKCKVMVKVLKERTGNKVKKVTVLKILKNKQQIIWLVKNKTLVRGLKCLY